MDKAALSAAYNISSFRRPRLADWWQFNGGPRPGEPAPDFDLPTVTGDWFRLSDHRGERPVLLAFGSITCPLTAAAGPALDRLFGEFGDDVWFVSVYTREAAPGERQPAHTSFEQKLRQANEWAELERIPWTIAVDWLIGSTHQAYGNLPHAAYLIDSLGHVAFRALWAGQEGLLRRKLSTLLLREPLSDGPVNLGESRNLLSAIIHCAGEPERALWRGGRKSVEDFRREMGLGLHGWIRLLAALAGPAGRPEASRRAHPHPPELAARE